MREVKVKRSLDKRHVHFTGNQCLKIYTYITPVLAGYKLNYCSDLRADQLC